MGKLVPQELNDEPANVLVQKIVSKKEALIAAGKMKKLKPLICIKDDELPFVIPNGWSWERLGKLAVQITDGTHHTPNYIESGVPFISVKDIDGKTISFDDCKYISQEQYEEINSRCNPEIGDLLICRIGTLGRVTVVDTKQPFSLFVSVGLLKFFQELFTPQFAHIVLHSPLLLKQYDEIKAGGSHTSKLNLNDLPNLLIPVPPLAEQHRIVEKYNELMALCGALKLRIVNVQSAQNHLADAVVEQATA
jgi:type I restriction enzyme S subunit